MAGSWFTCRDAVALVVASLAVAVLGAAALAVGGAGLARAAGGWASPVDGEVLERFRYGPNPFLRGQHRGVDIAAPDGSPVRSACAGTVTFAGSVGRSGRTVAVRCGRHSVSYGHLGSIDTREGRDLGAGDRIGRVGRSGRPRGRAPHVHLGVRVASERWGYVDPLRFLGGGPGGGPLAPPPRVPGSRRPLAPEPRWRPIATPRLGPVPRAVRVRVPVGARGAPLVPGWPAARVGRAAAASGGLATTVALVGAGLLLVAIPVGGLARLRVRRARRRREQVIAA